MSAIESFTAWWRANLVWGVILIVFGFVVGRGSI